VEPVLSFPFLSDPSVWLGSRSVLLPVRLRSSFPAPKARLCFSVRPFRFGSLVLATDLFRLAVLRRGQIPAAHFSASASQRVRVPPRFSSARARPRFSAADFSCYVLHQIFVLCHERQLVSSREPLFGSRSCSQLVLLHCDVAPEDFPCPARI
jgi:hypothetical protein